MISTFVVSTGEAGADSLVADLESVGVTVLGSGGPATMVQDVIRTAPDLVVCYESHPGDALFAGMLAIDASSPRPTVVFTGDPDVEKIERATRAGATAYIVNGYDRRRLRSVIHVAQARFRHVQLLRTELSSVNHRFAERKLVDRAKGILMRLRNLSEDAAYAELRSSAMRTKQRIGRAAQQIIDAARYGEAVNRAGQLRMFSQRLVKLYALACAEVRPLDMLRLVAEASSQVEETMAILGRILSRATFGDLLDAVAEPWATLRAALAEPATTGTVAEVDRLAERLLLQSEQLTANLESAGFAGVLRLINVSGRQRMLSQRLAKQAIVAEMLAGDAGEDGGRAIAATTAAYAQAMVYLDAVPLRTPEIAAHLTAAAVAWTDLQVALPRAATVAGKAAIFVASEALLAEFEALTGHYERNLQTLME